MLSEEEIKEQLKYVLTETNLEFLSKELNYKLYRGKVRDSYINSKHRILITSDRLSCFDVVVTSIPFKGQVLTEMAQYWFNLTKDIVRNHIIDIPDPNLMVVENCQVLPVEIIVRAYLAGSAVLDYQNGKPISGVRLPPGLKAAQKLDRLIITPSTKAEIGSHDLPISEEEIIAKNLVEKKLWSEVREAAFELFQVAQAEVASRGLILVDTKYEFGLKDGKLVLCDEIHTLDSSRYWVESSYLERFQAGEMPEMLDKQPTREWLITKGYRGEGQIPEFSDQHRIKIAKHYLDSYQKITGRTIQAKVGDVSERISNSLKRYLRS